MRAFQALTGHCCAEGEHKCGKAVKVFYLDAAGQAYALAGKDLLGSSAHDFELRVATCGEPVGNLQVRVQILCWPPPGEGDAAGVGQGVSKSGRGAWADHRTGASPKRPL